jgi:flagellar motor switch protein FliN
MTQEEIDALINNAKGGQEPSDLHEDDAVVRTPEFPMFDSDSVGSKFLSPLDPKIELLYDLQLPVSIELGRTNMLIRDILRLARGSVIEFDKLASEPVDVLINGKKVAEGEVVVIDKHFGIRITTLVDPADRLRSTRR